MNDGNENGTYRPAPIFHSCNESDVAFGAFLSGAVFVFSAFSLIYEVVTLDVGEMYPIIDALVFLTSVIILAVYKTFSRSNAKKLKSEQAAWNEDHARAVRAAQVIDGQRDKIVAMGLRGLTDEAIAADLSNGLPFVVKTEEITVARQRWRKAAAQWDGLKTPAL